MQPIRDYLGNLIAPGKYVVYPSKDESTLKMNVGKVEEIVDKEDWNGSFYPEVVVRVVDSSGVERKARLIAHERMVVVPESSINDENFITLFN